MTGGYHTEQSKLKAWMVINFFFTQIEVHKKSDFLLFGWGHSIHFSSLQVFMSPYKTKNVQLLSSKT